MVPAYDPKFYVGVLSSTSELLVFRVVKRRSLMNIKKSTLGKTVIIAVQSELKLLTF